MEPWIQLGNRNRPGIVIIGLAGMNPHRSEGLYRTILYLKLRKYLDIERSVKVLHWYSSNFGFSHLLKGNETEHLEVIAHELVRSGFYETIQKEVERSR